MADRRAAAGRPGRRALARWAWTDALRSLAASLRHAGGWLRPAPLPDRILFAPQDLRTADPLVADEMAAGLFVLGGATVRTVSSPFGIASPSPEWEDELFGLGWLRHLRASADPGARRTARRLIADAIGPHRSQLLHGRPAAPKVAARRILSILAHSPLLLQGADAVFFRRLLRVLARDVAGLERQLREAPVPLDRLQATIAYCTACLACGGYERRLRRRGTRRLVLELDRQILPDGGHLGRNPATLLELLLDLLPLRLLYASRDVEVPARLDAAIRDMREMLRRLRHPGGDLALFNGAGYVDLGEIATVLALAEGQGSRASGGASGYERLEAGDTVVIVDAGAPPPVEASAEAGAGALAFEMSSGLDRIVVNRGGSGGAGASRAAARESASASTLDPGPIADETVALRPGAGWWIRRVSRRLGPVLVGGWRAVSRERGRDSEGRLLLSCHAADRPGLPTLSHTRRIALSASGDVLAGEDVVLAGRDDAAPSDAVLRFHLHPAVRCRQESSGAPISLACPGGAIWTFVAEGGPRLEADQFWAVPEGARPSRQIVLPISVSRGQARAPVRWRFERQS